MPLNYSLYLNHMTQDDPDDASARPVNVKKNRRDDLINKLTGPGSILKPIECNAVLDGLKQAMLDWVREGESYSDFFELKYTINGKFINMNDRFDEDRHSVQVALVPTAEFQEAARSIRLTYEKADAVGPDIEEVYDWMSNTTNQQLTAGGVLRIKGSELKLFENDPDEGIYFVAQDSNTETKAEAIRTNEPKTLELLVPALPSGSYQLEVRNTSRNGNSLRIGIFTQKLTVA